MNLFYFFLDAVFACKARYFYRLGSTAFVLEGGTENYFFTAPVFYSEQSIQIWAIGDFDVNG